MFPRPFDPADYESPEEYGVNLGSDTIWCRLRHLGLAENTNQYDPVFHCPHASPAGGGICRDSLVDGATPFEHYRAGADTHRHLGYCDVLENDNFADCTKAGITDTTLAFALSLIPDTVTILVLNNNVGITELSSGIFDNLKNPASIKALIIEDCNIATLAENSFAPLVNLEILNMNQNLISELPSGILASNPKLKQFSMFGAGTKPGLLTTLPEDVFSPTPDIERIILYGHSGLTAFPANIFKGLGKCEMISFVACGFSEAGFPDGVFSDLVSLQWFDFFGNQITKVESRWFDGGWAGKILRVALDNNPITSVEAGVFDSLVSVENIYLHKTSIAILPAGLFDNNVNLISYTLAD